MNTAEKPWVRSIKYHTYWATPRDEGELYQVDTEQDAETLVALKLAVRDTPPARATRAAQQPPAAPPATPEAPAARWRNRTAKAMTTADMPSAKPPE